MRPQGVGDRRTQTFAFGAGEPYDFSSGTELHRRGYRFAHIGPEADVAVVASKTDVAEACGGEQIADQIGARHREWTWSAMHLVGVVVRHHGDNGARDLFGLMDPRIVFAFAPHNIVNVPSGLTARRMFLSAAPGKLKNIVPKRANA